MENKENEERNRFAEDMKNFAEDIKNGKIKSFVVGYETNEDTTGNILCANVLTAFGLVGTLYSDIKDKAEEQRAENFINKIMKS